MRWRGWLLALVLWLSSLPAHAQTTTLPVRAGEHADFTRLVIELPSSNDWQVSTADRTARLQFTGPPLHFDLSETFARIPRSRLRAARAAPDQLELQLACDCPIRASEDIPGFLVIDILDAVTSRPRASFTPRPPPRPKGLSGPQPPAPPASIRAGRDLARAARHGTGDPEVPVSLTLDTLFAMSAYPLPTLAPDTSATQAERATITQELARALAGSVAQGVLQGTESFDPSDTAEPASPSEAGAALTAHVSIPGTRSAPGSVADARTHEETCAIAGVLDMSRWAAVETPVPHFAMPPQLYGELDRIDAATLISVMQSFLKLGFGAEARVAGQLADPPDSAVHLLTQLGYLVDLQQAQDAALLAELADCSAFAHFWAFLATGRATPPVTGVRADYLIKATSLLPPHLRVHLGPEILQRLIEQDQRDTAQVIRAVIDRVAPEHIPALELARVALDLPGSPPQRAAMLEGRLEPQRSDDALLFLLSQREDAAATLEPELRSHAEDRLLALRKSDSGRRMAGYLLRAALRDGDIAEAVGLFERERPFLGERAIDMLAELLHGILTHADDLVFVQQVFGLAPWAEPGLAPDLRASLAERMNSLGFEAQAKLILSADLPPKPDPTEEENGTATGSDPTTEPGELQGRHSRPGDAEGVELPIYGADGVAISQHDSVTGGDPTAEGAQSALARARATQQMLRNAELLDSDTPHQNENVPVADDATGPPPAPAPADLTSDPGQDPEMPGLLARGQQTLAQSMSLRAELSGLLRGDIADP